MTVPYKQLRVIWAALDDQDQQRLEVKGVSSVYICEDCSEVRNFVYENIGVAPNTIRCEACGGLAYMNLRDLPDIAKVVADRWVRPTKEEYEAMTQAQKHVIAMGGLILKKAGE